MRCEAQELFSRWIVVVALAGAAFSCQETTPVPVDGGDGDVVIDLDADAGVEDADEGDADDGGGSCLPDPDSGVDADADRDADRDADADIDFEEDADDDTVTDADLEADIPDAETDADLETDAETDLEIDDDREPCPMDMVAIGDSCIDIYEASRPDATAELAGIDSSRAVSRPGVRPWFVSTMTAVALTQFEAACAGAGKRLCTVEEWERACCGDGRPSCPSLSSYVFGDEFDREACNNVDTFCDDHCVSEGLEPCNLAANCGYSYNCYDISTTGSFPACTNGVGTFDINGNVWEAIPVPTDVDARGYQLRGGAFNCANARGRVNCQFNATWSGLYAGFRCCQDR
jgi:hypothetical protein